MCLFSTLEWSQHSRGPLIRGRDAVAGSEREEQGAERRRNRNHFFFAAIDRAIDCFVSFSSLLHAPPRHIPIRLCCTRVRLHLTQPLNALKKPKTTQWPAGRCAFRMVRRPNGNILLASDGLSDPFDDLTLGEEKTLSFFFYLQRWKRANGSLFARRERELPRGIEDARRRRGREQVDSFFFFFPFLVARLLFSTSSFDLRFHLLSPAAPPLNSLQATATSTASASSSTSRPPPRSSATPRTPLSPRPRALFPRPRRAPGRPCTQRRPRGSSSCSTPWRSSRRGTGA